MGEKALYRTPELLEVGILRHKLLKEAFLGKSAKFKTIPVLRKIRWYLSFVIPMCEAAGMSGHTHIHIYIHTGNYSHPRCACAPRVNYGTTYRTQAYMTVPQEGIKNIIRSEFPLLIIILILQETVKY